MNPPPLLPPSPPPHKRLCLVIGSGVAGICSAYELSKKGYHVIVLDRSNQVSRECSRAPAGGMQKMNPSINTGMWISAARSLLPHIARQSDSYDSFRFFRISWMKALSDPHFIRWFAMFSYSSLIESKASQSYASKHMLKFTEWAVDEFNGFMESGNGELANKAGLVHTGAMKLLYGHDAFERAQADPRWCAADAEKNVVVDREKLLQMEPWLRHLRASKEPLVGGLFQTSASSADCEGLTVALAQRCQVDYGVRIEHDTKVEGFDESSGRISAIRTNRGTININPDTPVVVAAGSWTPVILRKLGLFAPVYPLKGYNLLMKVDHGIHSDDDLPKRIVADDYMYTTRLNDIVRVASVGEFSGWDTHPDCAVEADLRHQVKMFMPHLSAAVDGGSVVCGLRPFVSDGLLLIGQVKEVENLFVNTGPGFNGWKCAMGSARVLASIVSGDESLLPGTFDKSIFDPENRVKRSRAFCKFVDMLRED